MTTHSSSFIFICLSMLVSASALATINNFQDMQENSQMTVTSPNMLVAANAISR